MRYSAHPGSLELLPLTTIPHIAEGDDLAGTIRVALEKEAIVLVESDIVVIAQKIVSKAEGRFRGLDGVKPSGRALELHRLTGKDPRLVELILKESKSVLTVAENLLIVEHRLGHIMANAGIDRSNVGHTGGKDDRVLLLPEDPDRSADQIRMRLGQSSQARIGVIISDSFGRPWRIGTVGVAIGVSGPAGVIDRRGELDLFSRPLQATEIAFADSVATSASLAMGEGAEGRPVVIVRGLKWQESQQTAKDILRPRDRDMFR